MIFLTLEQQKGMKILSLKTMTQQTNLFFGKWIKTVVVVKMNYYDKNPHPVDIDNPNLNTVGILTNVYE